MTRKICLVIIDGLRNDTARTECGYLAAAIEGGQARAWTMQACLPTISAPLYETIHTGLAPVEHGLLSNEAIRPSPHANIFLELKAAGKSAGVVAHSYFHTLYGGTAFDPFEHVEINDPDAPIAHARYYSMAGYSQSNPAMPSEVDLCAQAWAIARDAAPDYLLLHTSSCDTLGHFYSGEGKEYRIQAWKVDNALSRLIPRLRDAGYDVMVTADHGMNADGHHAGDEPCLREVPFIVFSDSFDADPEASLDQRIIAPTVLTLLGVEPPETMKTRITD
jgi:predicted AlkP superfamily pyrophosphatase or phosphodiesterase